MATAVELVGRTTTLLKSKKTPKTWLPLSKASVIL